MQHFVATLNIVSPVFLLVLLGVFLKKIGVVDTTFVRLSSKFVFSVSLPALIFLKLSTVNIGSAFDLKLIAASLFVTLLIFGISWLTSNYTTDDPKDKGAFIQGSFRSNFAIIGLAIILNLIGENGLSKASMVLAFVMPLYNILAVIALTVPMSNRNDFKYYQTAKEVILNPLILSVIISLPFSIFNINIGSTVTITLDYLAKIALPLALISIGASLKLERIKSASSKAFISTSLKVIVFPVIGVITGVLLNFNKEEMVIIFILFACPTAIASFIMAEAMNSNSKLAGDIIVVSTLASIVTISAGITILKYLNFI